MKILLRILGGIIALAVLAVLCVWLLSSRTLSRHFTINDTTPAIPTDTAAIARGAHLAQSVTMCVNCHREDLSGEQMLDQAAFASVAAANLTRGRGGHGSTLSDSAMVVAIRHGIAEDGRLLFIMPSEMYQHLSDDDVAAIVAWVRTAPPVDSVRPPSKLGPIARTLLVLGKLEGFIPALDVNHSPTRTPPPPAGPTAQYGAYLVSIAGCQVCHGPNLSGGPVVTGPPGSPPAANITPTGLKQYDETAFFRALREGKRPGGATLDSTFMPWNRLRGMTDEEIKAVWAYLQTVPPRPYGQH